MTMHRCPGPNCNRKVSEDKLMCRDHWYQVPRELRDNVWRTYRHVPGTRDHHAAMMAAIASLGK